MFVGNAITTTALLLCPIVILTMMGRRPLEKAVATAIFGAAILLPERAWIDLPVIPPLDKHVMTSVSIYAGLLMNARHRISQTRPFSGIGKLVWVLVIGAFCTAWTNGDRLVYGTRVLPPLSTYDGLSMAIGGLMQIGLPFAIGRCVFRSPQALRTLLGTILGWAMLNSIFALIELRLSPQLHRWIWGYAQHSFAQVKRAGGFRPMIFMEHGLAVAIFFALAIICAVGARKVLTRTWRLPTGVVAAYLYMVLLLCKSAGALVFATLGGLIIRFTSAKSATRLATIIAMFVFCYPLLRSSDAVPTDDFVNWARSMSNEDRAESLKFRFDNENMLLERARERYTFGWGGFARQRVFDDEGRDMSVLDGQWIIVLGLNGWVGYVAAFGLLTFPVVQIFRRFETLTMPSDRALMATLVVAIVFSVADLLPNGLFNRIPYYLAGASLGLLEGIPNSRKRERMKLQAQRVTS